MRIYKLKIDFFISSLSGGGAEKVLVMIAERFAELGHVVSIVSLEKRPQFYFPNSNVQVCKIEKPRNGLTSFLRDLSFINKYMKKRNADVAFCFLSRCNLLVLLRCLFNKQKVIVCDRNNPKREHSFPVFLLSQLLYLRANRIVVQTEKIKSMYFKFLQKKICVIENPIDIEEMNKQLPQKNDLHTLNRIISMGRLENQKDFETLIDAFDDIVVDFPEWKLDIFGSGEREIFLRNYIKDKEHSDCIQLCGRTTSPFTEMSKSKIFVLSSLYEGFPNVLCEAMFARLVCISSNCISGPSEIIDNNKNGFLFEIKDVKTLSKLLREVIINYDNMEQLRTEAQKSVLKLDKKVNFNAWNVLILDLVGKNNKHI